MKLSVKQRDRTSEILGNISAAWFSAGVISPVLIRTQNLYAMTVLLFISISMAMFFYIGSMFLLKR